MARLGCLLIILSIIGLFLLIVIPVLPFAEDNQTIDNLLTWLICQPGETIQRHQYATYRPGETSYSMTVDCVNNEGQTYDATGRWMLIGMGAFLAPFLLGLFGFIAGVQQRAKAVSAGLLDQDIFAAVSVPGATPSRENLSLTERLKDLQKAREEGLISEREYERMRQQILDRMGRELE